jgi:hypothetical protein
MGRALITPASAGSLLEFLQRPEYSNRSAQHLKADAADYGQSNPWVRCFLGFLLIGSVRLLVMIEMTSDLLLGAAKCPKTLLDLLDAW